MAQNLETANRLVEEIRVNIGRITAAKARPDYLTDSFIANYIKFLELVKRNLILKKSQVPDHIIQTLRNARDVTLNDAIEHESRFTELAPRIRDANLQRPDLPEAVRRRIMEFEIENPDEDLLDLDRPRNNPDIIIDLTADDDYDPDDIPDGPENLDADVNEAPDFGAPIVQNLANALRFETPERRVEYRQLLEKAYTRKGRRGQLEITMLPKPTVFAGKKKGQNKIKAQENYSNMWTLAGIKPNPFQGTMFLDAANNTLNGNQVEELLKPIYTIDKLRTVFNTLIAGM
jgi:hypothetical protein